MKTLTPFLLGLVLLGSIANSRAQNCCRQPDMKMLALNTDFKAAHEPPTPFTYASEKGKMIQFPTSGGGSGNAFFVPAGEPTKKVLLVFHEWWGLNDYIKREAENWQKDLGNVDVYAVDLYDGQVATDPEMAGKLMNALDPKRGAAIIEGVLKQIGKGKQIATIGWCMGGSWSFTGTLLAGKDAAGCVMYYGFPESDAKKVKTVKADVFYVRANKDNFISREAVDKLGEQVRAAGHKFDLKTYEAVHAFANPSNPKYDVKAATEAHALSEKFLKQKLGVR